MSAAATHLHALVQAGQVSSAQVEALCAEAVQRRVPLSHVLLERRLISPAQAAEFERAEGPSPSRRERALELDPQVQAALADPARRLGRYALVAELGRGSFGVVYRAYDAELQREVAIKQLIPEAGESAEEIEHRLRRFQLEGQAGAKLKHPNIVGVLEVGRAQGRPYLVMDYVRGEGLDELLSRGLLSPRQIVERIRDVALALGHAHAAGIVHRDVKPGNVIVDLEGRAHLTDFGLAREAQGSGGLSHSGQILGTPLYLSPELAAGRPQDTCPQSDVFALGGVLYSALTGEPPFVAESLIGLIAAITTHEPIPPRELDPQLSRDLETVILKCLRKDPSERYADGGEVAAELERFLAGQAIEAVPATLGARGRQFATRHKALLGVVAGSALALALGAAWSGLEVRAERDAAQARGREAEQAREAAERARGEAETARARAESAESRAREEGGRARLAEAEARLAARGAASQNAVRGRQLARSLVEKGERLARTGFHNDAAAIFAESLLLQEDADARGGLARALERAHPALLREPAGVVTGVLGIGPQGFLVAHNDGLMTRCEPGTEPQSYPRLAGGIYALARSPSGWLAVGSGEGKVALYPPDKLGPPERTLDLHAGLVTAIAWAPDGERFLSLGWDGSARIGRLGTDEAARLEAPRETRLTCASWGAGGVALGDVLGHVYLWRDTSAADPSAVLAAHSGWVSGAVWLGEALLTAGIDGALRRYEPSASGGGYALARELALSSPPLCLTATPRGEVALGLADGTVLILEGQTFARVGEFSREPRPIRSISAAGDRIWTGSLSGIVAWFGVEQAGFGQYWTSRDLEYLLPGPGADQFLAADTLGALAWKQPNEIVRWRSTSIPTCLARSEDGRVAANGDQAGGVAVIRLGETRPRLVRAHKGPAVSVELSDKGERLLSAGARNVTLWDTATLSPTLERNFPADVIEADLDPRGEAWSVRITGGQAYVFGLRERPQELRRLTAGPRLTRASQGLCAWFAQDEELYCLASEGPARLVLRARASVAQLRVSTSGRYLTVLCRDGTCTLYDLSGNGEELISIRSNAASLYAPELDEAGRTWTAVRPDGTAGMWSLAPRPSGADLPTPNSPRALVAVDANSFVIGDVGGEVTQWVYVDRQVRKRTTQAHSVRVQALAYDPETRRIASLAEDSLSEIDLETFQVRRRLETPFTGAAASGVSYYAPWRSWVVCSEGASHLLRIPTSADPPSHVSVPGGHAGVSHTLGQGGELFLAEAPHRLSWRAPEGLSERRAIEMLTGRVVTGLADGVTSGQVFATLTLVAGRSADSITHSWGAPEGDLRMTSMSGELWAFGPDQDPRRLVTHPGFASGLARDPSGRFLAWGGDALYLYDARQERLYAKLRSDLALSTFGAGFLGEGRLLVGRTSAGTGLRVSDLEVLALLDAPEEAVQRVEAVTRLRVAGLEPVMVSNDYELALARALAAR